LVLPAELGRLDVIRIDRGRRELIGIRFDGKFFFRPNKCLRFF